MIKWLLNGGDISEDFGIAIVPIGQRTSLLTINSVEAYHTGNYTCLAVNDAGRSAHNARLNVNGILIVFDPPQLVSYLH